MQLFITRIYAWAYAGYIFILRLSFITEQKWIVILHPDRFDRQVENLKELLLFTILNTSLPTFRTFNIRTDFVACLQTFIPKKKSDWPVDLFFVSPGIRAAGRWLTARCNTAQKPGAKRRGKGDKTLFAGVVGVLVEPNSFDSKSPKKENQLKSSVAAVFFDPGCIGCFCSARDGLGKNASFQSSTLDLTAARSKSWLPIEIHPIANRCEPGMGSSRRKLSIHKGDWLLEGLRPVDAPCPRPVAVNIAMDMRGRKFGDGEGGGGGWEGMVMSIKQL